MHFTRDLRVVNDGQQRQNSWLWQGSKPYSVARNLPHPHAPFHIPLCCGLSLHNFLTNAWYMYATRESFFTFGFVGSRAILLHVYDAEWPPKPYCTQHNVFNLQPTQHCMFGGIQSKQLFPLQSSCFSSRNTQSALCITLTRIRARKIPVLRMIGGERCSSFSKQGRISMPEMMDPLFQQPTTSTHSCVDVSYGEALQGLCLGFSPRLTNGGALFKFGESNFVQAICESSLITEFIAEA